MANTKSIACSCDRISFEDAVELADEIFVGKITKVERFKNDKFINGINNDEIGWDWRYYFNVEKKWKGSSKSELIVYHHGTSCDLFFDIYEKEYLVYAFKKSREEITGLTFGLDNGESKLSTWVCSRTTPNIFWEKDNSFEDDVRKLDSEFPEEINLSSGHFNMIWVASSGLGIILIFGLIIRKLVRRKN